MLQGINRLGKSWVGKVVVAILFGFLIVSFAIWGIGDIFRGGANTSVATVGRTTISGEAFRNAYQTELQRLIRATRQNISPQRAREAGIDMRVLGRMVSEAALDQRARSLGLGVSDQLVAQIISQDPSFRGMNGQFDRSRFNEVLRANNLNEASFVREQRAVVLRAQIAEALAGDIAPPLALREAIHRFGNERRSASLITLAASSLGEIAAPSDGQLSSYFEERKGEFRAPEYRAFNALAIDPTRLAKPEAVSDSDVRARYESAKASFGSPERRALQQIVFATMAEAEDAAQRIKAGSSFEAIAAERKIEPGTLDLGTYAKSEVIDPAVADAAFALAKGAVSAAVQGRFGPALIRVSRIEPESVKPLEAVAAEIRTQLAAERARSEIDTVHDQIDDLRASARPLAEIAREKNLPMIAVPPVNRAGLDKEGRPVADLPDREALVTAVFGSDIGTDNEALRTRDGGYIWFDVTAIEPARERTLAEAREAVVAQWRRDEVSRQLADKARGAVERIDRGDSVETVAADLGSAVTVASDLARNAPTAEVAAPVLTRLFATPAGKAGSAAASDELRVVFKVTAVSVPPFISAAQQAAAIDEQLKSALRDDLVAELVAQLEKDQGVTINRVNLNRAVGGEF